MPNQIQHPADPTETEADRRNRLAAEMKLLAEAEGEAERDGTIPAIEVNAWIDSLGTDKPLPLPRPRRS